MLVTSSRPCAGAGVKLPERRADAPHQAAVMMCPKPQDFINEPRVQSTYIVGCRVSILGSRIWIWESIPHNST